MSIAWRSPFAGTSPFWLPDDAKGLLTSSIRDDDPVVFIEHKLLYMTEGEVPEQEYLIPLGEADVKHPGDDVTLVTYSHLTLKCLEAARRLESEGVSPEAINLRSLVPMDWECILASVRKTGKLVIAHEACKRGGVGGDIAARVAEVAFYDLGRPITRVAGRDTAVPFSLNLEKICVPSEEDIVTAVGTLVSSAIF